MIKCGVPQGSILGPLLFLFYINDLATVSRNSLPILFADDTNIFSTGKNLSELRESLNEDLVNIEEWLRCNRLSLNVLKTNYMIFTTKNKLSHDVDISVNNVRIERVYVTKFLGVQIDSKLNWKNHIEYTCKKCIGIISKARRKLHRSSLISLYYSFAFPYFIHCNHVWGNTYNTNLESIVRVQKKLVRIITCSSYRAHTEPLMTANNLLSIADINVYMTCIFVYQCLHDNIPNFHNFYVYDSDIHTQNTRQASDLHVVHARLDIRRTSMKTHGANTWNSIPLCVKESTSIEIFKPRLRKYLIDQKMSPHFDVHNWYHTVFWLYRSKWSCMHADYLEHNKLDMCN